MTGAMVKYVGMSLCLCSNALKAKICVNYRCSASHCTYQNILLYWSGILRLVGRL